MPQIRHPIPARAILRAIALAAMTVSAAPALADSAYQDRVHADSFGNLVIYSAAGYKRIIVGRGEAADGYNATGSYYEQDVAAAPRERVVHCYYEPMLLKGRSHMYGLPEGVIVTPPRICR
jgi:hypothetical protein